MWLLSFPKIKLKWYLKHVNFLLYYRIWSKVNPVNTWKQKIHKKKKKERIIYASNILKTHQININISYD